MLGNRDEETNRGRGLPERVRETVERDYNDQRGETHASDQAQ